MSDVQCPTCYKCWKWNPVLKILGTEQAQGKLLNNKGCRVNNKNENRPAFRLHLVSQPHLSQAPHVLSAGRQQFERSGVPFQGACLSAWVSLQEEEKRLAKREAHHRAVSPFQRPAVSVRNQALASAASSALLDCHSGQACIYLDVLSAKYCLSRRTT